MILASLLSDIPSQDLIDYLCHIESPENGQDPGEIGDAWQRLKQEALNLDMEKLDDEYHALFIGVGRGEIVQYGSWHLTGFLMDTPLSELRDDLRSLGFESNPDQKEPEDHISAICETMSILINSDDIESYQQRRFFIRHLHPWAEKFFRELQSAKSANFYQAVGMLGERFIKLENLYLNIQEH
jgi:TorA maturation chaperone TorD